MLAGAGLRDDTLLIQALAQQRLAEGVVDLMRTSVIQVLTLQIDLRFATIRAAQQGTQTRTACQELIGRLLHNLLEEILTF